MNCRRFVCATALLFSLTSSDRVFADDSGLAVSGRIELPAPANRKSAPPRGEAFVPRAQNALVPPRGHDPRLQMVVVLTGGPIAESDKTPRPERYEIIGENFRADILPIMVGGKVEIQNLGRKAPRLFSKSKPDVVPGDPINKKGVRSTIAISDARTPIDIRDQDSVHFLAHIVAFESPYYSQVDHRGNFSIQGVPAGTWTVKLWHKDGFVSNLSKTTVTVGKRAPKAIKITLPAKLKTAAK